MTTFLRLLEANPDQKGATMAAAAAQWRSGSEPDGIFEVEPSSFEQVPGSPFAYWVSERVRRLFSTFPGFSASCEIASGTGTLDDFRFLRAWWEPGSDSRGSKWYPFAKGGSYAPFYHDLPLSVNWADDGHEMKAWIVFRYGGGHWARNIRSTHLYFRPGLTWPRRTNGLSFRPVGRGAIFGDKGPMAFIDGDDPERLLAANAVLQSVVFLRLVQLQLARTDLAQSFEVGLIGSTPFPTAALATDTLGRLARSGFDLRRESDTAIQTSHAFTLPALMQAGGQTLAAGAEVWATRIRDADAELIRIRSEIDDAAFRLYGIDGEDRRQMEEGFGSLGSLEDEAAAGDDDEDEVEGADSVALTEALLEWALGVALGRFDVRLATGDREPPPEPEPFDPLPVCSPGMLQDKDGLPARKVPAAYPLELPPHGLLVDDPGHPLDVVARLEEVFARVAGEHAHSWLQEAEGILGRDLRDWIRRYGFERHLKRYSRSRRKAPLFWHLAPKSREYGIWLYSPVATRDTFYRILNDYVDPKLKAAERKLLELRQHAGGSPTGQQRKELNAQESLVEDLRGFREQVALAAPLWKPHRDDGVVLNCALLSRLFEHHRTWQKECEKRWAELADGEYDWAGWAIHLWPERVVRACASNRSIAIAHGLEEALWEEDEDGNWVPSSDMEEQIATLVAERRSPAVESALEAYERAG